ncbi:MAG: hypothetical protein HQL80_07085 [Magnetococcales bacterium]|nr:hypothetical protein [Magnetococcales bacterium]
MPTLIVIDGLEQSVAEPGWMPVLDRLAATGRSGRLQFGRDPWFELFGHTAPEWSGAEPDLPLGYAMALGLTDLAAAGWPDPALSWCCLGFTHLYKKQDDLIFLSAERTGQSREIRWALVEALLPDMEAAGWQLYPPSRQGPYGVPLFFHAPDPGSLLQAHTLPMEALEGKSFRKHAPTGPYARDLLSLLTVGQLILARHPINLERQRAGRVALNTPWIWGMGSGVACAPPVAPARRGCCWSSHPVWAGLARGSGLTVEPLDEEADFAPLVAALHKAAGSGWAVLHLSQPALLARHGLLAQRQHCLQRINDQLLEPLSRQLASTKETLMITSTFSLAPEGSSASRSFPWVLASGAALVRSRRFWQRGRLGVGPVLRPEQVWSLCGI